MHFLSLKEIETVFNMYQSTQRVNNLGALLNKKYWRIKSYSQLTFTKIKLNLNRRLKGLRSMLTPKQPQGGTKSSMSKRKYFQSNWLWNYIEFDTLHSFFRILNFIGNRIKLRWMSFSGWSDNHFIIFADWMSIVYLFLTSTFKNRGVLLSLW